MPILDRLQDPADLRGLSEAELVQLAAEIRETIIRTVAVTGWAPRILAGRGGGHDCPAPAPRVAAGPHRVGHGAPGVRAQAADGPPRPLSDAPPDRRPRRLPTPLGVSARRDGRRARRHGPVHRPGAGHGARHPPLDGAHRGGRGRRRAAVRPQPGGPQRHRPPADAAADRPQRQRDVDQPVRGCHLQVPVRDQALPDLAAEQDRLRHGDRADAGRWAPRRRALAPPPAVGRLVRPAGPAVRGPGDHLHRRDARPRPPPAGGDVPPRARAHRPGHRPRPDPEGEGLQARRGRPGLVPRRGAAADGRWRRSPTPTTGSGRARPSTGTRWTRPPREARR